MPVDKHSEFFPPKNDYTIWRYMSFAKYIAMLESRSLYFPRADQLEDCYEGMMSEQDMQALAASHPPEFIEKIRLDRFATRNNFYINCWHINRYESAAMWKLYSENTEGIAIRSSCRKLEKALDHSRLNIRVCEVQYADYATERIFNGNAFMPITHKRLSFSHEKELRAIITKWDNNHLEGEEGVNVRVCVNSLIDNIYIAPLAPRWFRNLVENSVSRYRLNKEVISSPLYSIA